MVEETFAPYAQESGELEAAYHGSEEQMFGAK
jgi:hypothetical protein